MSLFSSNMRMCVNSKCSSLDEKRREERRERKKKKKKG
jgi:hypothetical protein